MADPAAGGAPAPDRRRGLRDAVLVGLAVVGVVAMAAIATFLLPVGARDVVFRSPLLIVVLIVGTTLVLYRITRPERPGR